MALVMGIVAAIFLGSSDFFASKASRLVPSVTVTRTALVASCVLAPLVLLIKPVDWHLDDVAIAALSGVCLTIALSALYKGYSTSPVGIIAPTTSVLLAAVPVAYGVVRGDRPGAVAWVGMGFGLAALVLTSYTPGGQGSVRSALILGTIAGFGFGAGFSLLDYTDESSGLMPVLVQRVVALGLVVALRFRDRQPLVAAPGEGRKWAALTGILAMVALAALQLGYRWGSAGPVSVATSQFATVAVVLSVVFNKERLRWWQAVGVAATGLGVALMALG